MLTKTEIMSSWSQVEQYSNSSSQFKIVRHIGSHIWSLFAPNSQEMLTKTENYVQLESGRKLLKLV